ncbi:Fic family protein [Marinomonas sp. M1K-6]|uniref:Fic family protein n=1 Tax=Marinomonas profundi TaxID=2726122 RepID=A0A847R754_9GAMM|nr:Fic family protein [Marinomonas profundi]NLQ17926.1 Fic family protein [Marinomonas profundi]UDV03420.1 Fic family protein [Marinomonas profundi]
MNPVSQKLADSLEQLAWLQKGGVVAIEFNQLSRLHRERLMKHGFIREVIRGWYIPCMPDEKAGDSTAWYTSFWDFCAVYLSKRFGTQWCLSSEQSISLHIGDRRVPPQLLVRSPKSSNKPTKLLFNTSIFDVRLNLPDTEYIVNLDRLNLYSLSSALVYVSANEYVKSPIQMRTALSMVTDASEILSVLLKGNHSVIAGRLVGAFRNIGRDLIADNILKGMRAADLIVQEVDPFAEKANISFGRRDVSPYVNRIRLMWAQMRTVIIETFPKSKNPLIDIDLYMAAVEDSYVTDAYHSLSIEGYRVTRELIELVRSGNWQADASDEDKKHLDAMAAKGYWDAFQEVKKALRSVIKGENSGQVLEQTHSDWYLALFGPSVAAGIIKQTDLAGYRTGPVYIRQSMHTPPSREALRDMMPTLFDLLTEEENPAVRVVLGHFMFVYIHPYFDGNGRMGRFIMNLMMASGGYPWTVIPVERRTDYMEALEAASSQQDILPFSRFLASLL